MIHFRGVIPIFKITVTKTNGRKLSYPKVTEFRTSNTKLGQRISFRQTNGVKIDIAVDVVDKFELERVDTNENL